MVVLEKYDVLVVGAGIIGLTSAYHLKRENPDEKVLVVDKFGAAGQGNTAKSAGLFRNVFSSRTNFLLADSTVDFFLHVQKDLKYDLGLELIGYLFLQSEEQFEANKSLFEDMRSRGVKLRFFGCDELAEMIPGVVLEFADGDEEAKAMGLTNVYKGVLGVKCGAVDIDKLVRFYEEEFKKLGGAVQYKVNVSRLIIEPKNKLGVSGEPFLWQDKRVTGVKTDKDEIYADTIVLAPGAWANQLLDPIGVDSLVKPKKRQVFALKSPSLDPLLKVEGFNSGNVLPVTILPVAGIFFRPVIGERAFWAACADELGRAFMLEEEPRAEEKYYEQMYMVLRRYFPHFEDVRPFNMWAGLYAINSVDANPYILREAGLILATGASGSGIMKADAIGRIVDALYRGKDEAKLYGNMKFKVSDLGVEKRNVENEEFVI